MTAHRATAMPIQLCIDTRNFMGVRSSAREENRGHRLHFRDGGELYDWLCAFFGDDWHMERPIGSPFQVSWALVSDDALVGILHVYTDFCCGPR